MTHYQIINHPSIKKLLKLQIMYISSFLPNEELCWNDIIIVSKGKLWEVQRDLVSPINFTKPVNNIRDVFRAYALEVAGENDGV